MEGGVTQGRQQNRTDNEPPTKHTSRDRNPERPTGEPRGPHCAGAWIQTRTKAREPAAELLPHVPSGQGNTTPTPSRGSRRKEGGGAPSRGRPPRRLLTVDSVRPPTDTASPSSTW